MSHWRLCKAGRALGIPCSKPDFLVGESEEALASRIQIIVLCHPVDRASRSRPTPEALPTKLSMNSAVIGHRTSASSSRWIDTLGSDRELHLFTQIGPV